MNPIKKCLYWALLACTGALLSGCDPCTHLQRRCPPAAIISTDTILIEQVKVDTFLTIQSDTSKVLIYIDCDSLNQPQIKEIQNTPGKKIQSQIKYIPHYIEITSTIDSFNVYLSYYNTHFKSIKTTTLVPQQPKRAFTGWVLIGITFIVALFFFLLIKIK